MEDKDFDVSFTPIRQLVEMNLHNKGIQLYPGELEQITAANLIAEFGIFQLFVPCNHL